MHYTFGHRFKFLMAKYGGKKEIVVFNNWSILYLEGALQL